MTLPRLSVVLPSYRRLPLLPAVVAAHLREGADEVVLVLDGPHAGWREALSDLLANERVVVLELPSNRGLALARIAGLETARGDIILMADDDVEPRPGLIDRHRRFHAANPGHVLLGYMPVPLPARRAPDAAATYLYARDYEAQARVWEAPDSDVVLGSLWGGNVSVPRELYLLAEAYKPSERLDYNEDLDLGIRLRAVGARGAFDGEAMAWHHHHRDLAGFARESVVRGEAIRDLERRWGSVPPQLVPLVTIPPGYQRLAGWVQRRIAARSTPGVLERVIRAVYRGAGAARAWRVQDGVTRLLRRGLVMRGYRQRVDADPSLSIVRNT